MENLTLLSWNVNGIRACIKNGFLEWLYKTTPNILCLQETKIDEKDIPNELANLEGYYSYWNSGTKKGYAGTAVLSKEKPFKIDKVIGIKKFDDEGRFLILHYKNFILINVYFPNSQRNLTRLKFKLEFNNAFLDYVEKLKNKTSNLIITGDFNVAHKEIDLKNPKQNEKNAGFTIEERTWMDNLLSRDYIDTFRFFNKSPGNYSWWTYRFNARQRNIGWRVDYFITTKEFIHKIKDAYILKDVLGSDHAPVGIDLTL